MVNLLDFLTRSLVVSRYFTKGWGSPYALRSLFEWRDRFSSREECYKLVSSDYPVKIDKDEMLSDCRIIEGHFVSPFATLIPDIMPEESRIARFQAILPKQWTSSKHRPVVIHLAGTGDHFFWRRRAFLARPLLKQSGIASIILENPFYGCRKPKSQSRSSLHNVSDLFVMGGALMLESLVLLHWCENRGLGPLGITGISMGGHMASLAATVWPKPLALIPCLSWSTASTAFTEGVMSNSIPWKLLREQYNKDKIYGDEFLKSMRNNEALLQEKEAFIAGINFAQSFVKNPPTSNSTDAEAPLPDSADPKSPGSNSVTDSSDPKSPGSNSSVTDSSDNVTRLNAIYANLSKAVTSTISSLNVKDIVGMNKSREQKMALHFMAGVMDEFTHLANFPTPVETSCVIIVAAKSDSYIPRDSVTDLQELWPGAELRVLDTGHVGAFIFKQSAFRKAIVDSMQKLTEIEREERRNNNKSNM